MSRLKDFVSFLSGFRKLLFAIVTIIFISGISVVVLALFLAGWYIDIPLISGDNLTTLYTEAFKYTAAIAGSYMAANVCVKGVREWLAKKK